MSTTVRQIVDGARIRHWAFSQLEGGDGALVLYLDSRLRTHLSQQGASIEGLVGTSMTYDLSTINGILVASVSGVPVYGTTYEDGWPVHMDGSGVPYVDFTEPPVATDPFGAHGGTPGFPLPGEMVRLIQVALVMSAPPGVNIPCNVVPESARFTTLPGRNPNAFVSGNRLVPLFAFAGPNTNTGDRWFNIKSITISYVAVQTLATLDDILNFPAVLTEALIADAALYMANQSKQVPAADRAAFAAEAQRCALIVASGGLEMLNESQSENVAYQGD